MRKRTRTLTYHPVLDTDGRYTGGTRDCETRLAAITHHVDVRGKTVLDLGCQAGFFSINLARSAKKVIAVDTDPAALAQARRDAGTLGLANIDFLKEPVTASLVESIGQVDLILFMSVLHHIVIDSRSYERGQTLVPAAYESLLHQIRQASPSLVFEIGEITEKAPWTASLEEVMPRQKEWIYENVFASAYDSVTEVPGPNYSYEPLRSCPWLHIPLARWPYGRKVLRRLGMEWQDFRTLYIARKTHDGQSEHGSHGNPLRHR